MNKYTFFTLMSIICCAMSFYHEDTIKEGVYVMFISFWVTLIVISKIYDIVIDIESKIDKLITSNKESNK